MWKFWLTREERAELNRQAAVESGRRILRCVREELRYRSGEDNERWLEGFDERVNCMSDACLEYLEYRVK